MPKLITKFRYLKPGSRKSPGGYAEYIATREGVEKIDESRKHAPCTKKQQDFIEKLLKDFPETKELPEYETYCKEENMGTASELISSALEEFVSDLPMTTYADYIATRPRAERFGAHGLFTNAGEEVILSRVSQELNAYTGNVYTAILSLKREDAERLGFNTGSRWRDFLRTQTDVLAENLKIPISHLRWYAAYHNESYHPHVHLIAYSTVPREGYLTEKGVENLRSTLANSIFQQELLFTYERQGGLRDDLRKEAGKRIAETVQEINEGTYHNPEMEQQLRLLSLKLMDVQGKKVYGYLKPELKAMVDAIVEALAREPGIAELYALWYSQREAVLKTYTDTLPERIPLRENKTFQPIRNAVVQAALKIIPVPKDELPGAVQDADLLYDMGKIYYFGRHGVVRDKELAMDYLLESAKAGNANAANLLVQIAETDKRAADAPGSLFQRVVNMIGRKASALSHSRHPQQSAEESREERRIRRALGLQD